jgi:hypothetical protein
MRISMLFTRLRQWSSQAFRKRYSPAAFRTCRNAGNCALTVEGTTSKGKESISCEVEFCMFYRLSLRTLRTKDVFEVPGKKCSTRISCTCKKLLVINHDMICVRGAKLDTVSQVLNRTSILVTVCLQITCCLVYYLLNTLKCDVQ